MSNPEPKSNTLRSKRRRSALRTAAFLSPWLIGFTVFFAYPLLSTVYFSFMHYDGFKPPTWAGTRNWTYVFEHYPYFWPALRNTLWLVLVMVTLRVLFGLGVGLLITRIKTGTGVFRTLFYLPYLAPPVAATMAFAFLLNPGTGPVNSLLEGVGIPAPGWFNDPAWSKAGPHPARPVGRRRPDGHLHGRAARRTEGAVRGGGAGRRVGVAAVPVRDAAEHLADHHVRRRHRGHPDDAVLHAAAGRREGRLGRDPGRRHAVRARLPGQVDAHPPQLVYNLGFQRFDYGSACVVALVLFALSMAFTALLMRRRGGLIQAGD